MKVDLLLKNGFYLDVYSRTFVKGDIAINDGKIVGIDGDFKGDIEKDITGKYVVPGFLDGHIHLESSIISPENFAKLASMHGTTAVVTDPHEITNVCGLAGMEYMLQKTRKLPIDVFFMVPSCVPATEFDESAGEMTSKEVAYCFDVLNKKYANRIIGLAEVMNYPGVINQNQEVMNKINVAKERGLRIDGHAPGLSGEGLVKYISAGIESDHECSRFDEAVEKLEVAKKLNQKFTIMIREGTAAKNLTALAELINMPKYKDSVMFVTDDKHPEELKRDGHIDAIIRKAIGLGVKPEDAFVTATYNMAKHFGLSGFGEIKTNAFANLVVLDDLKTVQINSVYKNGVELNEKTLANWQNNQVDDELDSKVKNSIKMHDLTLADVAQKDKLAQVIGLQAGEIITTDAGATTGYNLDDDIIKIVVIESHKGTMHTGVAYLKGMGLKSGAVGTTVAHDSHYMIIAGTNDSDIVMVANELRKMQGGKIFVENGEVKASLQLEISGLMTDDNLDTVIQKMSKLKDLAKVNEGIDPFMNLSFVSLAVIGDVRLLPSGAFDVRKWGYVTKEDLAKKI